MFLKLSVQCFKETSGVLTHTHTHSWLCTFETNIVAATAPLTIPANQYAASGARKEGVSFDLAVEHYLL